jgi:hypothetical protein
MVLRLPAHHGLWVLYLPFLMGLNYEKMFLTNRLEFLEFRTLSGIRSLFTRVFNRMSLNIQPHKQNTEEGKGPETGTCFF